MVIICSYTAHDHIILCREVHIVEAEIEWL